MSKLNKIFFGPAGTGKTRRATREAVEIVSNKLKINFKDIDEKSHEEKLKSFSKTTKLKTTDKKVFEEINKLNKDSKSVAYSLKGEGKLEELIESADIDKATKIIEEYRVYPLIETVTFHPSYSYQDFVEGISVETNQNTKQIEYKVKDGIFKKICKRAESNGDYDYVLIIDEINRGDISSIFGELFTLIEDDKRGGVLQINLPYSKDDDTKNPKKLSVPTNLYILATMNTVDKSIALIDVALRRRFDFEECMPSYTIFPTSYKGVNLSTLLETMNRRITILKNEHYQIGHSYFLDIKNLNDLQKVMVKEIIPLLQEYFYDDWKSICAVLNQSYENPNNNKILIKEEISNKLFKPEYDELITYTNPNKIILKINKNFSEEDIKKVYE